MNIIISNVNMEQIGSLDTPEDYNNFTSNLQIIDSHIIGWGLQYDETTTTLTIMFDILPSTETLDKLRVYGEVIRDEY